jgi:hypothetical protein
VGHDNQSLYEVSLLETVAGLKGEDGHSISM